MFLRSSAEVIDDWRWSDNLTAGACCKKTQAAWWIHMILLCCGCGPSVHIKRCRPMLGQGWSVTFQQEVPPPPLPPPFVLMEPLGGSGKPWNWMQSIPSKNRLLLSPSVLGPNPALPPAQLPSLPWQLQTGQDRVPLKTGLWFEQMSRHEGNRTAQLWAVYSVTLCGSAPQATHLIYYRGYSSIFGFLLCSLPSILTRQNMEGALIWLKVSKNKIQEIDSVPYNNPSHLVVVTKEGISSIQLASASSHCPGRASCLHNRIQSLRPPYWATTWGLLWITVEGNA